MIVSEDNGADLGRYGNNEVYTPNLDQLATEGALFDNAFVTYSVCSPSRSTIFTGLYPHQNGQIGLATHKFSMYKSFKTLPVYLKEQGYRTGCLGKIHVNPESAIPFDFHPLTGSNFAKKNLPAYAKQAAGFITASEAPFFLMVNYPDAHYPLQKQVEGMPAAPLETADIKNTLPFIGVDSKRLRGFTANYYNSMNRLDEAVGMLLQELKDSGKEKQTLVIYLGDHGPQFSRGKCSNYEAGLRVPFIMRWPGSIGRDKRISGLISIIDILPTVIEAAGSEIPAELPGLSLLPVVLGQTSAFEREYIFAGGMGSTAMLYYPRRSVRDNRYKLIRNLMHQSENPKFRFYADHANAHFDGGTEELEIENAPEYIQTAYATWRNPPEFELYDLQEDPHEFDNLIESNEHRVIFENLKTALSNWQKETHDPMADLEKLNRFTAEVAMVNHRFPNHTYTSDSLFRWEYQDYFYQTDE
ncbi:MAG: hypothetical protein DHS20C17_22490 [Cyclobacteriaceae bacterium]|nr:MAG: hypothetical protein DHS20C17_22490 [Cyclobacteriaceae bacterium]